MATKFERKGVDAQMKITIRLYYFKEAERGLVYRIGFEPMTYALKVRCPTD